MWVVTSDLQMSGGPPEAAFTVKNELIEWLRGQPEPMLAWMHVWRCENPCTNSGGRVYYFRGHDPIPQELDKDELLASLPEIRSLRGAGIHRLRSSFSGGSCTHQLKLATE